MKNLLYAFIYNPTVNFVIRNVNKLFFKKLVKVPPAGKVKFSHDNLSFYIHTNQTNYITHVLFYEGFQNFEYASIFMKLINKCSVFIDIGANTGFYTVLGCKINTKLKVICFEPAIGSLHYLSKSVTSNGISDRVVVEPIALSDHSGVIEFNDVTNDKYKNIKYNLAGESSTAGIQTGRPYTKYPVKCITLDDYIKTTTIGTIDLMKIDTEGTEDSILRNASTILKNDRPIIICETLFNRIESNLEEIMKEYGYELYNHYPTGLIKVETIKRKNNDGVTNCFFVHPDKKHLIQEFITKP